MNTSPTTKPNSCLFWLWTITLFVCLDSRAQESGQARAADKRFDEVTYKTIDELSLKMRIYKPADWSPGQRRPAIVWFFGGGWQRGSPKQFHEHCLHFASMGMVAIAPEYRIQTKHQSTPFESSADAQSALRWVRSHAVDLGVDPERIAAGGGSAGGHLAAVTATITDDGAGKAEAEAHPVSAVPNALLLLNPALDLAYPGIRRMWSEEVAARIELISPYRHLSKDLPPTIIFHGTADGTVPYSLAEEFTKQAKELGVKRIELVSYEGREHGFFNAEKGDGSDFRDTLARMDVFLASLGWVNIPEVAPRTNEPAPLRPIEAPFPMPPMQRPVFPDRTFAITDFGAVSGGETLNLGVIQKAIEACAAAGGGRVLVPPGRWLTTPLELRSDVNLHVEAGAELVFTGEKKYYFPEAPPPSVSQDYAAEANAISPAVLLAPISPISAYDAENIAVTGSGRLDGQGILWWPLHSNWWERHKAALPGSLHEEAWRSLDGQSVPMRPKMIQPYRCRNVLIEGVTLVNSPMWTVNPVACENVIVRRVTIRAKDPAAGVHAPNTDGINPESCRNVLIEDCDIATGDDSIALKSGLDEAGRKRGLPCENVVIRRVRGVRFAIGSEMSGGVRNVLIQDCELAGGMNTAIHLKTRRGRGGVVENVHVQDVTVGPTYETVLWINMQYWSHVNPAPPEPVSDRTPRLRNLHFRNIRGGPTAPPPLAVHVDGLAEAPIENVTFTDIDLTAVRGAACRNLRGAVFRNIRFNTSAGPVLTIEDGQDIDFLGCTFAATAEPVLSIQGSQTRDIRFDAATAVRPADVTFVDGALAEGVHFGAVIGKAEGVP